MQLYTFAGEIDMEIAIASFRKSLPQWCCPSLQSDGAISVEEISHPLMADAIPNDFVLKKGVVLTGANASGKSTFMKAVAINVILAQTINTCVAKNMKMPAIQVCDPCTGHDKWDECQWNRLPLSLPGFHDKRHSFCRRLIEMPV
jgi:DNA mismatch repair ATPase MutS